MAKQEFSPMVTRRRFAQLSGMAVGAVFLGAASRAAAAPDVTLEIAPYTLEASPKHHFRTVAYNGQVPGPLLRMRQGQEQTIEVRNLTTDPEVVHWHGLFLPSDIDGAMESLAMGIAGAGNSGTALAALFAPRLAMRFGWQHVYGF